MSQDKIAYSLIIPTYNRAEILKQNLSNIGTIKYDRDQYEVIVVDDGSTDNTKEIVLSFNKIRYLRIGHQGAATARNNGAKLSAGNILIFIDDDCFPAQDYLTQMDSFWQDPKNSQTGILSGFIGPASKSFFGKICDYFDFYNIDEGPVLKACTSNFSIYKDVFLRSGGFNVLLTGAEDTDLSIRIRKMGYKIYFSSKVRIFHHHTKNTLISILKRTWSWAMKGEIHLELVHAPLLCPSDNFFDRLYANFIKQIKLKLKARHLFFYPLIGLLRSFSATYYIHRNNRLKLGLKIQYLPFTFLISLTHQIAFLFYLVSYRRRHFRYFKNKLTKNIFKPFNLLFSAISACNYRCGHCFYYKELNATTPLPFAELLNIIKRFKRIDELSLTGGEPFLRKDLVKIVEAFYLNSRPYQIDIPTNGWCHDEIIAVTEELLERLPLCQINIFLSFHGLKEIHDAVTQVPGSFHRTLQTGKSLRKKFSKHPRFYLSSCVCVHSKNIEDIEKLIEYMQGELPGIYMNFFPVRGKINSKDIHHLSLAQRKKMYDFYEILQKKRKTDKSFKNILAGFFRQALENGYQYNIRTNGQFITCFAATGASKLEETGFWRPCEILEEYFDLNLPHLDTRRLEKILADIRAHRCSCTHDCFFEPALESNPYYRIKNYLKAVVKYSKNITK